MKQEDGVATAVESIYRDLEYARSLIKRPAVQHSGDEGEGEHIENGNTYRRHSRSGSGGAPSEDWSVISSDEERRSSFGSSGHSRSRERPTKKNSLAAAVLSVLPDALTPSSPRRRTVSTGSQS
jgi:sterol 3beta-glucosyltransferase